MWCWRRLLRVPWTAQRLNQSILKEINCEYSLERLKLKLQYVGHLIQRADSLEKTLMLRKVDGRRRGQQWMRWLWEGNRQEGQGSPNWENRLQGSLKILCCCDDTWFYLNWTFLKPWVNQCVSLTEIFFLSYANEIMYLLWNLPFFKMVPPKTNFWLLMAQQSSIHISCFMAGGWHTSCHPISKMHIVGEGPGEILSALRCLLSD